MSNLAQLNARRADVQAAEQRLAGVVLTIVCALASVAAFCFTLAFLSH
ncbi:MAG: hypothetical protein PHV02_18115 [Rhodocyclaceae bacterium]|nr:hypothetical protein [Rhodocyclaceae bacterium]